MGFLTNSKRKAGKSTVNNDVFGRGATSIEHILASKLDFSFGRELQRIPATKDLGPNQLHKLVLLLGSHFGFQDRFQPQKVPFKSSIETSINLVSRAESVLRKWPDSLESELTLLMGTGRATRSVRRTIGYLYEAVHTELTGGTYETIRADFDEDLSSIWNEPILNQKSRLARVDSRGPDLETGTQFAHRVGIKLESVVSKIDSGTLSGTVNVLRSGRRQITLEANQVCPNEGSDGAVRLCMKEAAFRLKLPVGCVRELISKGYLSGAKKPGNGHWEIERQSIEKLLSTLSRGKYPIIEKNKNLSLDQIARYYLPKTFSLADVVCGLIDRELEYGLITELDIDITAALRIGPIDVWRQLSWPVGVN